MTEATRPEFLQNIHDLAEGEPDLTLAHRGLAMVYNGEVIQDKETLLNLAAALKKGKIPIDSLHVANQIDRFLIINAVSLFRDQVPELIKWIDHLKERAEEEQQEEE